MDPRPLRLPDPLVRLENPQGELLLMHPRRANPFHVRRGKEYVLDFLRFAGEAGSADAVIAAFPNDRPLLNALLHHGILESVAPGPAPEAACGQGCAPSDGKRQALSLYLLLSQSCNLSCVYCLNGSKTYQKTAKRLMPDDVAFRAVDQHLATLAPGGRMEIVFFGGEPFLNWGLCRKIITFCETEMRRKYPEQSWHYHATTNLTLFPDDLLEWVKKHGITFLVNVDGPPDLHDRTRSYLSGKGSHAVTARNIRRLVEAGVAVALRATVTSVNQHRMVEVSEHHRELGGSGSAFVALNPVNSDEEIFDEGLYPNPEVFAAGLLALMDRPDLWKLENLFPVNEFLPRVRDGQTLTRGCGAPFGNTPVVDVNGDVYACIYWVGILDFRLGNLFGGQYPDQALVDRMLDELHVDRIQECRGCEWRFLCGGGCPVKRMTVDKNPRATRAAVEYSSKITCLTSKTLLEALLWRKARENLESALPYAPGAGSESPYPSCAEEALPSVSGLPTS